MVFARTKRPCGVLLAVLFDAAVPHSHDVAKLAVPLNRLVDKGNTAVLIEQDEHNLDIIKVADHIIDMGPEGGDRDGEIVAAESPVEVSQVKNSYTGGFLRPYFNQ